MPTIFEAINDAALNYVQTKRTDINSGDYKDISAADNMSDMSMCACRGKCGSHTGPCTMKASKDKMCKACNMATSGKKMKAGGPGSGRHSNGHSSKYNMSIYKMNMKNGNAQRYANHHSNAFNEAEDNNFHKEAAGHKAIADKINNAISNYKKGNHEEGSENFADGMHLHDTMYKDNIPE